MVFKRNALIALESLVGEFKKFRIEIRQFFSIGVFDLAEFGEIFKCFSFIYLEDDCVE